MDEGSGAILSFKTFSSFINRLEGNGTPLQYSCLENPMDGGAWWAAVHGVTKSRAQLSDFTFTFHFHALEKEMATTPVFLPGESQGWGSLVGCHLWGRTELDTTEIRLIIFFAARDGEALYSQQKQDQELTVAQIMNSLLPNSD